MSLIMYERVGFQERRPSPFSWRVRYALAHKGVEVAFRPTRFADVETIRRLSGQHFVPIIVDGDVVVHDSLAIAMYLERRFPERPSLFGGPAGMAMTRLINQGALAALGPAIRGLISADFIYCLAPEDRAYFRRSREAMSECTLETLCADRGRWEAALMEAAAPLEQTLGAQPFECGDGPGYADYLLFSVFQYARLGCPREVLGGLPAVWRWRDGLVARFDGLGDRFPGYPAEISGPDGR